MNLIKKYLLTVLLLALSPLIWAKQLEVVTTFSILGDITRQIGGDRVKVTNIIKENQDVHAYQMKPQDVKIIQKAELILVHGIEFEPSKISRAIESSKKPVFVATKGIIPLKGEEDDHGKGHDHDHDHGKSHAHNHEHDHDHGKGHDHAHEHNHGHHHEFDPHIWHNPQLMKVYAKNIANALIKQDPQGKEYYSLRLTDYQQKLEDLDNWAKQQLAAIPVAKRKILTAHDAFAYLEEHYQIHAIAPLGMSEESQPSAKNIADIVRQVKKENIKAVFIENIKDEKVMKQLARETNLKLGDVLYSDSLGDAKSPASTYLDLMRHNINSIVKAIKQ